MGRPKTKYVYNGPVRYFEDVVCGCWNAETYAVSEKQALNNLAYRYKKEYKYDSNSKITLNPDYIYKTDETIGDYEYYDKKMKKMIKEVDI